MAGDNSTKAALAATWCASLEPYSLLQYGGVGQAVLPIGAGWP